MTLTDGHIESLLTMPKRVVNPGARQRLQKGSFATTYDVVGLEGSEPHTFRLFKRQNKRIKCAFSCGLLLVQPSGATVMLTRYNGSDHDHSNPLEDDERMVNVCHVHRATSRYMALGRKAEHFAEVTQRYCDLQGAMNALAADCNVVGLPYERTADSYDFTETPNGPTC